MKRFIIPIAVAALAAASTLHAEPITVLTSGNRLLTVDHLTPGTVTRTVTITGLASGESLLGIDYRPAVGGLFGLGSTSRIYSIDANTGVATVVGTAGAFTLNGTRFGFDFNPVPDRIRVTSDADQNLRLNPNDGTSVTDGTLTYAPGDSGTGANPNIVGSAYLNNFSGALNAALFGIDSARDVLVVQNPPNDGVLVTRGPLGFDTTDNVGFDISGITGNAYAALTPGAGGATTLHIITLLTGAASSPGAPIATGSLNGETVVDIAAGVNAGSRLRNLSARGRVGAGDDVLIGGFIARGSGPGVAARHVVRAIGPSLGGAGVGSPLADPVLTLFDSNGMMVATNDDFAGSPNAAAITAAGLAPTMGTESAILVTLAPGDYTAHVRGKGTASGVALVEIFELP